MTNPLDAVCWDKAGELIMAEAARVVEAGMTDGLPGAVPPPIRLYKNNTDSKGASYGTHENYLMRRDIPFGQVAAGLIPFLVTRQVFAGAGRVSIGQHGQLPGYQLSQRADFIEAEVGLETTLRRPIVNTRDEPHASAEAYRRLHVIIGDANMSEVATYLKLGTTALVLDLIEAGRMPDLTLLEPVPAVRTISHDPSCRALIELEDGTELTAVQVQWQIWEAARKLVDENGIADDDTQTEALLARWESVLTRLEDDPMLCATELDWAAKGRRRSAVQRYPPGQRAVPPAGGQRRVGTADQRRTGLRRGGPAAAGHPRLLPGRVRAPVWGQHQCGQLGLGGVRPAGRAHPQTGTDDGAHPRQPRPRGRTPRRQRECGRTGGDAGRQGLKPAHNGPRRAFRCRAFTGRRHAARDPRHTSEACRSG